MLNSVYFFFLQLAQNSIIEIYVFWCLLSNFSGVQRIGTSDEDGCTGSFVGIAYQEATIKTVLSSTDESTYDLVLCDRFISGNFW